MCQFTITYYSQDYLRYEFYNPLSDIDGGMGDDHSVRDAVRNVRPPIPLPRLQLEVYPPVPIQILCVLHHRLHPVVFYQGILKW